MRRAFRQVDVFTAVPYRGNALAVVLDGDGLSTGEMQRFANWMSPQETTFVSQPSQDGADYQVRIFTAEYELPFAGHPTLGSCHAWLSAGGRPGPAGVIVQQCPAGLVTIRRSAEGLAFAAPPPRRRGPVDEPVVVHIAAVLGIGRADIVAAEWVDNGPGWLAVLLASADAVLALRPGVVDLKLGAVGCYPAGSPQAIEVRAFFPNRGATAEDAVTGSLNAGLAQWLVDLGVVTAPYVASQGTAIGRCGRVHVSRDPDATIWVGGATVSCISGHVEL